MSDTTVRRPIKWRSCADTNVGKVRQINEDSILSRDDAGIWAVADGMGGYEAGDVASNMIVRTLDELESRTELADIIDAAEDSLEDVNFRIQEYADIMLDGRTLGSTVVSLIIRGRVGVCLWVGDSRLYRLRSGKMLQLSRDHSQVEELITQGQLTPEEAVNHPDSNVITRAVGAHEELYVDINVFSVQLGDTLLLCSDGLYNTVKQDDIRFYMTLPNINDIVSGLIDKALDNGASDNVSIIVVRGEPDNLPGAHQS